MTFCDCLTTHHAIWHPLSRRITFGYCDNIGCFLNGIRELLFPHLRGENEDDDFNEILASSINKQSMNQLTVTRPRMILDKRGYPIYVFIPQLGQDLELELMKIKNLSIDFKYKQRLTPFIPLRKRETQALDWIFDLHKFDKFWMSDSIYTSQGHLISFGRKHLISNLSKKYLHGEDEEKKDSDLPPMPSFSPFFPFSKNFLARLEPKKPLPPVINIFIYFFL